MEPYDDMDRRLRPLVGLDGPAVSITVSGAEVDTLRQMVTSLSTITSGCRITGVRVLRELDVRHGAAAAMQPEKPLPKVKAPLSADELDTLRRCHDEAVNQSTGLRPQIEAWTRVMRELDRRLGAAQAAAAERAAAGSVEHLDQGDARFAPFDVVGDELPVEPEYPEHVVEYDPLDVERDIADGLGRRAEQLAAQRAAANQPRPLSPALHTVCLLAGVVAGGVTWWGLWMFAPVTLVYLFGLLITASMFGPIPAEVIRWTRRRTRHYVRP